MNWEAFGAVGEMMGAFTVILTLIYLARQLVLNTQSIRSATVQELLSSSTELHMEPMRNRELGELVARLRESEEISRQEIAMLFYFYQGAMNLFQNIHYQYLHKNLDSDLQDAFYQRLVRFIRTFGREENFRVYWAERKLEYTPSFVEYVESALECLTS